MILSNISIHEALDRGWLKLDPEPIPRTKTVDGPKCPFQTSAVDLRLGIASGVRLLDSAEREIMTGNFARDDVQPKLGELVKKLGYWRNREVQLCVVDSNRRFIYHDWEHMRGNVATQRGADGEKVYETVMTSTSGAACWSDESSNVAPDQPRPRFNIAIFRAMPTQNWRLIVEVHQELS